MNLCAVSDLELSQLRKLASDWQRSSKLQAIEVVASCELNVS